jgi:large subunit ribosomal protein L17
MRHLKDTVKLNRTTSHRRCMFANMLKSLIENESITTTVVKAKELRRHADRMVTLAKKKTLSSRRKAIQELMIRFNTLTPKEARAAKEGDTSAFNTDRIVIEKLFDQIGPRFENRAGGYTRIIRTQTRKGDNAEMCIIEYLPE